MSALPDTTDTICAVATPPGAAGIAVVRVSGAAAIPVAARLVPALGRDDAPRRLRLCRVVHPDSAALLDQALVAVMPGPRSYTGQDVVELQLHGGRAVVKAVLEALWVAGARLARPGEFTLRAFLNQRLDLSAAEAVAGLVEARSDQARRVALRQLEGGLRAVVEPLHEACIALLAEIEAQLDFPEEDLVAFDHGALRARLQDLDARVARLLEDAPRGRRLREGARVVLLGRPNVGKSSLLNALVGRERAIVDAAPGTTRDWVEDGLTLEGVDLTLVDTAGQRVSGSTAEDLGVLRGREQAAGADFVVYVVDVAEGVTVEDQRLLESLGTAPHGVVLNQRDRATADQEEAARRGLGNAGVLAVTVATTAEGIGGLRRALLERVVGQPGDAELPLVTEQRHEQALSLAAEGIRRTDAALTSGQPEEVVALELREVATALGGIVGRGVTEAVLDQIFSRFCLGK